MYSDERLKEIRLKFLRENRRTEYRRLRREGILEEQLAASAARCVSVAKGLIESGTTHEAQAWLWAIRSELLETVWD